MLKIISKKILFILILNIFLFPFNNVQALTSNDAYQAIVQIKVYTEDENYYLHYIGSGSGVIIDDNGLILTNSHVINPNFNKYEYEYGKINNTSAVYKICLTTNTNTKPDCSYSANLIAQDSEKDIALLKMETINGVSPKKSFPYLEKANNDEIKAGQEVRALGYPGIGGETITQSTGIISGVIENKSDSWIKTEALISYGSSGGALVSQENGNLLGITTGAYSDYLGSIGYVININSIKDWIKENQNKAEQISEYQERMENIIKQEKQVEENNKFTNTLPGFSIDLATDWDFYNDSENYFSVVNEENKAFLTMEYKNAGASTDYFFNEIINRFQMTEYYENPENITINGIQGKKLKIKGETGTYMILFPYKNYYLVVYYDYGKNNSGQEKINQMINSFQILEDKNSFQELKEYRSYDPYFYIKVPDEWVFLRKNSYEKPVSCHNKIKPYLDFDIMISYLSESKQEMTNKEYYNYIKKYDTCEIYEETYPFEVEVYAKDLDYQINNEINNEIFYKCKLKKYNKDSNKDEVKAYAGEYKIREGDILYTISFFTAHNNKVEFEQDLAEFEKNVLSNFTIGRKIQSQPPVVEEIKELASKKITQNLGLELLGKILLKVEDDGESWYLSPKDKIAYFLGRPKDAFRVMREQGIGITNADLLKIPVALDNLSGLDSDQDGLPDLLEDALGFDKNKADSNDNGILDKKEITKMNLSFDVSFIKKQKGKIFLQTEGNGEAWYIINNQRYFLGRPNDAFSIMRFLGLGISNQDFEKI